MSVALVPTPSHTYHVRDVLRVVDGDTAQVIIDKDHGDLRILMVRLLEVDTPERKDKAAWQAAKEYTDQWLARHESSGALYLEGHRFDSFGRCLGYFWEGTSGEGLNHLLVANGYGEAVPLHVHLKQMGAG
jgi:endonuclease YncB( thermonuclease family)